MPETFHRGKTETRTSWSNALQEYDGETDKVERGVKGKMIEVNFR